ncbi:hypothetical protein [Streptomyces goshikiensis]|uniref:hypothetical protein n=1 Tax=Streptomyces goshikiensis TaxID=1942 RepID=UPI003674FEE9
MPTTYPPGLPAVPDHAWNADLIAERGFEHPVDERALAVVDYAIDAGTAAEAELRLLAYINRSGSRDIDLRGATATAQEELTPGRWAVTLRVPGEY